MNDVSRTHDRVAVRASDAEREQSVALLQRGFADGRLTLDELEERVGAAYLARTTTELSDLTADLPATEPPRPPRVTLDTRLLCILLCVCPPAGLAYWLLAARRTAQLRARLMSARPWLQVIAAAVAAGAGVALQVVGTGAALKVVSHLAGAVLLSAGVVIALPAISRTLRRTRVIVRRAFPGARPRSAR